MVCGSSFAVGDDGFGALLLARRDILRAERAQKHAQRRRAVLVLLRQHVHGATFGLEQARAVGIAEEGDGLAGLDRDDVSKIFEEFERRRDEIGDALEWRAAGAALDAGGKKLRRETASCRGGELAGEFQAFAATGASAQHHEDRTLRLFQRARHIVDALGRRGSGRRRFDWKTLGLARLAPGGVAGQNERGDFARPRRRDGARRLDRNAFWAVGAPQEMAQGAGDSVEVRGQRRVILEVMAGVVADDVDDAGAGFPRIVEVGEAIGEARPQMQQCRGRRSLHAEKAIGRAGRHALEQAEHAAHRRIVQRLQKMHFRGAGIGETELDALADQGFDEAFGAVHVSLASHGPGDRNALRPLFRRQRARAL